jgi:transcriptional regulator with XRE-family HTH domain
VRRRKGAHGPRRRPNAGTLAAARIAAGLTVQAMAARCGVTTGYLCDLEKEKRRGTRDRERLRRVAEAYGLSPAKVRAVTMGAPAEHAAAVEWLRVQAAELRRRATDLDGIADCLESEGAE